MSACSPKLSCGNMHSNILCVKTRWLHELPGLVIIYFLGCPIVLSRLNSLEKRTIVHGGEREPHSEAAVSLRKMVTFVTWPSSRTEFLVQKSFYNDIFVDVRFKRFGQQEKVVACLHNTSTFVPNDRSQRLYCVLPIMRCAFGAHLDVYLAERRSRCRFVGNLMFPSLFVWEDGRLW